MKYIISIVFVMLFFTNSIFAQKVEGQVNQKKIENIFDGAQKKIFFETSYYILKIGISEDKAKKIASEVNIYTQLKNIKLPSPTAYNCLIKAKFPSSNTKDSLWLIKNNTNGLSVNGLNIDNDIASLNTMVANIVNFLETITGDGTTYPYKANIQELKTTLEGIVKQAKTDAENYLATDDYKNNLPNQQQTVVIDNTITNNTTNSVKDEEAWNVATTTDNISSYKKYKTDFPKGIHITEANNKIEELQRIATANKEEQDWQTAKTTNTIEAYNTYITAYQNGKYVKDANNAITKLKDKSSGGEDEPSNSIIYILSLLFLVIIAVLVFIISKNKKKLKEQELQLLEKQKLEEQNKQIQNTTSLNKNTQHSTPKTTKQPITTNTIPVTPPVTTTPKQKPEKLPIAIKGDWTIVGASVIGKSHIETGKPCQDSHSHIMLNEKWGIAVTSDGAGSAKHSDIGSKAVSKMATTIVFKKIVEDNKWHITNNLPSQEEWEKIAKKGILEIYAGLKHYAKQNNYVFTDLACTVIVNIFSPNGILVTHIGDGRAGYRTLTGEWKASITPHSGEESNQTIFMTSAPWIADENFKMSGVSVPESRVINEKISAFTSMSDGGEAHLFESSKIDPISGKWSDPNKPAALFDKHIKTIIDNKNENVSREELNKMWEGYITKGTNKLANEPDDKTVILGILA